MAFGGYVENGYDGKIPETSELQMKTRRIG